jgi:hypothetical protein
MQLQEHITTTISFTIGIEHNNSLSNLAQLCIYRKSGQRDWSKVDNWDVTRNDNNTTVSTTITGALLDECYCAVLEEYKSLDVPYFIVRNANVADVTNKKNNSFNSSDAPVLIGNASSKKWFVFNNHDIPRDKAPPVYEFGKSEGSRKQERTITSKSATESLSSFSQVSDGPRPVQLDLDDLESQQSKLNNEAKEPSDKGGEAKERPSSQQQKTKRAASPAGSHGLENLPQVTTLYTMKAMRLLTQTSVQVAIFTVLANTGQLQSSVINNNSNSSTTDVLSTLASAILHAGDMLIVSSDNGDSNGAIKLEPEQEIKTVDELRSMLPKVDKQSVGSLRWLDKFSKFNPFK